VRRKGLWIGLAPLCGVLAALTTLILDDATGLFPLLDLRRQVAGAEERLRGLERERDRLGAEIGALRSDPLAVESFARRELGMVRPGEIVVRWGARDPVD
jgi:cell division protein FtsB